MAFVSATGSTGRSTDHVAPGSRRCRARTRRPLRGVHGVGGGARADAVPGAGRRAARAGHRQQRDPGDADRLGQEPGGHRTGVRHRRPGRSDLLHRADQGPGQREVLHRHRDLRSGAGRHDDRRRLGQRRRRHHLLHRRGAGQRRAAAGSGAGDRQRGDGRVPLLRRPGPRLGLAGAAAGAARRPVPADVGDPGRRHPVRARPDPADGPPDRGDRVRRTARCRCTTSG